METDPLAFPILSIDGSFLSPLRTGRYDDVTVREEVPSHRPVRFVVDYNHDARNTDLTDHRWSDDHSSFFDIAPEENSTTIVLPSGTVLSRAHGIDHAGQSVHVVESFSINDEILVDDGIVSSPLANQYREQSVINAVSQSQY
jgi:hypothetical protein